MRWNNLRRVRRWRKRGHTWMKSSGPEKADEWQWICRLLFKNMLKGKGTVMCSDCNNLLQTLFRNLIPVLLQIDTPWNWGSGCQDGTTVERLGAKTSIYFTALELATMFNLDSGIQNLTTKLQTVLGHAGKHSMGWKKTRTIGSQPANHVHKGLFHQSQFL